MVSRWAVICGMVRDEQAMIDKLEILAGWKADGYIQGVVFSTWIGEIDRYPEVKARFSAGDFILVELEPPLLKTVGHSIHQSKTLWYGLQAVPQGALVLKLRPDLAPLNAIVRDAIVNVDLGLEYSADWPSVFNNKILLAQSFAEAPFYLNDIMFYGEREDLLKIANFDLSTEFLLANTAPEQFFFRGPFAALFPQIEAYLQIYPHFIFDSEDIAERRRRALLDSDFFLDVIALNFRILNHYFRMGFVPEAERAAGAAIGLDHSVSDFFGPTGRPVGMAFHLGAKAAILEDERPIQALLQGHFVRDALGIRMARALDRTADPSYRRQFAHTPLLPAQSVVALQRCINVIAPGMHKRIDEMQDPTKQHFRIRGSSDRVGLTVATDETKRLEEEVNQLRRIIDDLRARR